MGKDRDQLDRYYTPPWCTKVLIDKMDELYDSRSPKNSKVLEPCCGMRDIADVLEEEYTCNVDTIDIDPGSKADRIKDFIRLDPDDVDHVDWIITNPPYQTDHYHAVDFIEKALDHRPRCGIAQLLRMSILEPCDNRAGLLQTHPPTHILYLPRPRFKWDATDSVTSVWLVWVRDENTWADHDGIFFFDKEVRQRPSKKWVHRYDDSWEPAHTTQRSIIDMLREGK